MCLSRFCGRAVGFLGRRDKSIDVFGWTVLLVQLSPGPAKLMQYQSAGGKYKMKSGSHKIPSLSTHKNTPKNQVKAQVQREHYCCNIQYMMVLLKLDWKVQTPRLHFSVSYLHVIGAQELPRAQGYLHISFYPLSDLQIYCKNKQPGNFRRSSLPCPEKSSDSAHWGSSLWPCLSWILPGIPMCSRSCREKSLVCPWHYCSSPFPLPLLAPFPLEQLFPCLLCPDSRVSFTFLFPLIAYGIYKSHFSSLGVLKNHAEMKSSFVFWIQFL